MKTSFRLFIFSFCSLFFPLFVLADENPQEQIIDSAETSKKDIFMWSYNATHTKRIQLDIDTTMDFFYLYEPNGTIANFQVNVADFASPSFSLQFTPKSGRCFFLEPYSSSLVSVDEMTDYTAQHPYSNLTYTQGLNSEQSARFQHIQNINKYCNLGFNLNFYKNIGEWEHQSIKGQHVTPWISYYGPRFSTTFKYAFNNIKREENGGIADDSLLHYEKLLRMKFTDAVSSIRYQDVQFVQKWNLGHKAKEDSASLDLPRYKNAIGYQLNYWSAKRYYSDSYPDTTFYNNVLYDSTATVDTTIYKELYHKIFIELQRKFAQTGTFVANLGVGNAYCTMYNHDYDYRIPEAFYNCQFYHGIFDVDFSEKLSASHHQYVCFAGSDKGAMEFYTKLNSSFGLKNTCNVTLSHCYEKMFWNMQYYLYHSNNYSWLNDFNAVKINDFGGTVASSWGNMQAECHYYLLGDYISFAQDGSLHQTSENGHALTAKLQKTSRFWHILMKNALILQDVSVKNVEYPNWALYSSLAFQGAFWRKLIHFGIGAEVLYYPSYHTPTYDAALGDFIPQSIYEYGSFPIVNAFATIRYKPIRLYVKYTSLYALLKEQNYMIAGYPQSNGSISFGISWLFNN